MIFVMEVINRYAGAYAYKVYRNNGIVFYSDFDNELIKMLQLKRIGEL